MSAIIANPGEDTPRLALADWLQEHGDKHDQARAEFIRLQIETSRLPEDDRRRKKLEQRAEKIVTQHREVWVAPLVKLDSMHLNGTGYSAADWPRGLLERLFMPTQTFLLKAAQQALPDVFTNLGVETIEFTSMTKRITA